MDCRFPLLSLFPVFVVNALLLSARNENLRKEDAAIRRTRDAKP
jgi:hypothetical protein